MPTIEHALNCPVRAGLSHDTCTCSRTTELDASLLVKPVFANRIYVVRLGDGSGRIAFGERLDSSLHYHVAVRMPEADVLALRDLLLAHWPIHPL